MMTVHEVASMAGVSERTLRYYDRLGLLPPAEVSPSGYRLYGEDDLKRLQQILFLRELDFPLKEIGPMLAMEALDRKEAVRRHRELLETKAERLRGLINLCGRILKGENEMSLEPFSTEELEQNRREYAKEARERWGNTDAYRESEKRCAAYGKKDWEAVKAEQESIFREFASLVGQNPACAGVQATLRKWRDHISARFYPCTDEILRGLGQMYVADERFRKTLDSYGPGTAKLMSDAIAAMAGTEE